MKKIELGRVALAGALLLTGGACASEPYPRELRPRESAGARATEARQDAPAGQGSAAATEPIVVRGGLAGPESALHDERADVYLVSNVHGDPSAASDDGFITRVAPDGRILEARWIDGADEEVVLHAPKGMVLAGDVLYVADVGAVRAFDRVTGAPLGSYEVAGSTFLNDVAIGTSGLLLVTDSAIRFDAEGVRREGEPAILAIDPARPSDSSFLAVGEGLDGPNGLLAEQGGALYVTFLADRLMRVREGAEPELVARLPAGRLDGLARLPDGSLLVSSWEARAVWRIDPTGAEEPVAVLREVGSPADIGLDRRRRRLLVPQLEEDRFLIVPLVPGPARAMDAPALESAGASADG